MVGERNGAYDARFPDFAFPDDTRASRVRIADTHHVHARNSTGNQMLAGPSRAICLCGRRVNAGATRSCCRGWPGERERRTNCLVHARLNGHCTIPRCERVARRRRTTVTNAEYCVSTRENRTQRFTAADRCLSTPIAFSGARRRNSWFSTRYFE